MPVFLLKFLVLFGQFVSFLGSQIITWVKQEGMRLARAARALLVWASTHVAARMLLATTVLAAFEVFALWLTSHMILPLANDVLRRLIPAGSAGDGIVYILWDSGLCLREAFRLFVLYVANYTLMWRAFSAWLQACCISLATWKTTMRSADAVRQASV